MFKRILVVVLAVLMCTVSYAGVAEKVDKIDEYSGRLTVTNIVERDGVKNTNIQEKVFTVDELNQAKAMSEQALKSWQDKKKECDDNIALQQEQIALWDRQIAEFGKQGIISKPKEEVKASEPIAE
jgi:hypothetical protein